MKKQNIVPVVFSVLALILLTACVFAATTYAVYYFKNKPYSDTPGTERQTEPSPVSEEPGSMTEPSAVTPVSPDESTGTPASEEEPPAYVLAETPDAGQFYIDRLTFLGDSTTYGMIENKVLTDRENTRQIWYGPHGTLTLPGATSHLLNDGSLEQGVQLAALAKEKQPQILVITLGAGVSYYLEEEPFKTAYTAVIETVLTASPTTKIICNSIYPVCQIRAESYEKLNNADIAKCNGWIREVVKSEYEKGKAVYYLDSYSLLIGSNGYMPMMYSNGDGLHLSPSAFNVILDNLRRHALPL